MKSGIGILIALFLLSLLCVFVHDVHQPAKIPVYFQIVAYNQAPDQDAANVKNEKHSIVMDFFSQVLGAFLATFGGIITAFVVAHFSTKNRAEDRLIDFRGFLGRWVGECQKTGSKPFSEVCFENIEHLWGYFGKCRHDFENPVKIKILCESLTKAAREATNDDACKKSIADMLDEIMKLF